MGCMPTLPGAQPLYITNGTNDAETSAFELAMGKVSQTHSNLGKVLLKIIQAVGIKPHGTAHQEMIDKLKDYKKTIESLTNKYQLIVQNKRIPELAEATTSNNLKKLICNERTCVNKKHHPRDILTNQLFKFRSFQFFNILSFSFPKIEFHFSKCFKLLFPIF